MKIITNSIPRNVLCWHDLSAKERYEFDYLDTDERRDGASFVRYRNWVYDLGEFMRIAPPVAPHAQRDGWERFDGYHSESYFSAVLVRYVDNFERVVMALALS
jgi:hypothetical protein